MANEWIAVQGTGKFIRTVTVSDANNIPKGAALALTTDPNTVSAGSSGAFFYGVAVSDKSAADGSTQLGIDIGGVWDVVASGAIPLGQYVILAGDNKVQTVNVTTAANAASGGLIVGMSLETASDAERIKVDLDMV